MKAETFFSAARKYAGDCYVADYTDKTSSERGVEISEKPFEDIEYFYLKKRSGLTITYIGVNFEEHPAFIKGIQNCECMFVSKTDKGKPWLMMLEMKYCGSDNIEGYTHKAYMQMKETLDKVDREGILRQTDFRRYFVYSVPEHAEYIPFGEFTRSQNDTLRQYEKEGIKLIGNNKMLIATPQYLFEPKRSVF